MSESAMEEFRAGLADALGAALAAQRVGTIAPQVLCDVVAELTADWHASRQEVTLLPSGPGDDAWRRRTGKDPSGGDGTPGGVAGIEISVRVPDILRPATEEEQAAHDRRVAALEWPYSGRSEPPPDGVRALDMLDQDQWWRTRDGATMRLEDMEPEHRANLIKLLRRRAVSYHDAAAFRLACWADGEHGDAAHDALESAMREAEQERPTRWLEEQPLMRRLRQLDQQHRNRIMRARGRSRLPGLRSPGETAAR